MKYTLKYLGVNNLMYTPYFKLFMEKYIYAHTVCR